MSEPTIPDEIVRTCVRAWAKVCATETHLSPELFETAESFAGVRAGLEAVVPLLRARWEAEQPTCGKIKPGNHNVTYLPTCALPSPHPALDHWWCHEPSGDVITWSEDGTRSSFASGMAERIRRG